jgi:hypothetical protein
MSEQSCKEIKALVGLIRELHDPIDKLVGEFRIAIAAFEQGKDPGSLKMSEEYWRLVAHVDALIRVRIFIEKNFSYIESMSLLAVTRYLFELTVWLKLIAQDTNYGLVYYRELLVGQKKYYDDLRNHLVKEIAFFNESGARNSQIFAEQVEKALSIADEEKRSNALASAASEVNRIVDSAVARRFSLYGDQARFNGYSFQAYLIEQKALTRATDMFSSI